MQISTTDISRRILLAILAERTPGGSIQDATRRAAFKANVEAEAKGWSVAARAALLEDFAQAGVSLVRVGA